jgi:hypothetical protein
MQFFVLSTANGVLFPYSSLERQLMSCNKCPISKARFLGVIKRAKKYAIDHDTSLDHIESLESYLNKKEKQ